MVVTRKCLCIQTRIIQVRLKCHVAGSVLGAQGAQAEEEDRVVQIAADARWGVSAIKAAALQAAIGSVEEAEAAALVGQCHLRRTRQGAQEQQSGRGRPWALTIFQSTKVWASIASCPALPTKPAQVVADALE